MGRRPRLVVLPQFERRTDRLALALAVLLAFGLAAVAAAGWVVGRAS